MTFWHEWGGSDEEYDVVEAAVGKDKIKPTPSITWKSQTIQVFDDVRGHWIRVRPGDYILEEEGKVRVTSE